MTNSATEDTEFTEKMKNKTKTISLEEKYRHINENHKKAIRSRLARSTIGSSVGRVLEKGSKEQVWPILEQLPVDEIIHLQSEQDYKNWFENQLNVLAKKIHETNNGNTRIYPGYKWGHATKILCLYLHDIVMHREYFLKNDIDKVKYWLYCPIDSQIMSTLKKCGVELGFDRIKKIDEAKKFYDIQDMLGTTAKKVGVPRIWFDDNWADR
ncbi:MAG: hypothetical protein PHF37_02940 [Phycisphaerae bacterium]|nr:hypothetical protein [Phycisphaerae bacterium]